MGQDKRLTPEGVREARKKEGKRGEREADRPGDNDQVETGRWRERWMMGGAGGGEVDDGWREVGGGRGRGEKVRRGWGRCGRRGVKRAVRQLVWY